MSVCTLFYVVAAVIAPTFDTVYKCQPLKDIFMSFENPHIQSQVKKKKNILSVNKGLKMAITKK